MIRILIAEDSATVALILKTIFNEEPDMEVVGIASNGREAVEMAHELNPDLITMDIRMPIMDGFDATRMIMTTHSIPIVIISSNVDDEELRITFRAIEEGALAVLEKPKVVGDLEKTSSRRDIIETVRAMAEVPVVKRRLFKKDGLKLDIFEKAIQQQTHKYAVLGIATSTGGPKTLQYILSSLPQGFPIPILIVQHISKGFISGLVNWLRGSTLLDVRLAENNMPLKAGTVYFAPDNTHLTVEEADTGLIAKLITPEPDELFCPSGDRLFRSLAQTVPGRSIGLLLTGMGNDGAQGLLKMHEKKCLTLIQDEESSIIFSMPGSALALGAVDEVVKLEELPSHLAKMVSE